LESEPGAAINLTKGYGVPEQQAKRARVHEVMAASHETRSEQELFTHDRTVLAECKVRTGRHGKGRFGRVLPECRRKFVVEVILPYVAIDLPVND
jgi:hypothetical protein